MAITQEVLFKITSKVNQIIYSSLPVYTLNCKSCIHKLSISLCVQKDRQTHFNNSFDLCRGTKNKCVSGYMEL